MDLPESILVQDILLRLPVKALLRFRCVSKYWLSLISSSEISTAKGVSSRYRIIYGNHTADTKEFFTCPLNPKPEENGCVDTISLNNPKEVCEWSIVGSCNGLVCLHNPNPSRVILWNPATREWRKLLFSDSKRGRYLSCCLGYDAANDEYKVVLRVRERVKIYCLRANSWINLDWPADCNFYGKIRCIFACGAIHWVVTKGESSFILALNITTETFYFVDNPYCNIPCVDFCGTSKDRLCLYHVDIDLHHVDIWILKEYGIKESWTKLACIQYVPMARVPWGRYQYLRRWDPKPLFVLEDEGIILVRRATKLTIYHGSSHSCEYLQVKSPEDFCTGTFVESLVSPYIS